jgi:hypothetical protein
MRALLAVLAVAAATPGIHHTTVGMTAAHRALLQRGDLGAGWSAGATPKAPGSLACATPSSVKGVVETGAAVSPTYRAASSGPFVSSSAFVYDSSAGAAKYFTQIAKPQALKCLAQTMASGKTTAGVTITVVKRQVLPAPSLSTTAAAYRVVGRAAVPAQKVDVYADVVLLQRGNAISEVTLAGFSAPLDPATERRIVRVAAARL